jgi:hypothetical protein
VKLHDVNKNLGRRDFLRSAAVLGTGTTLVGLAGCSEDGSPLEVDAVNNLEGGASWVRLDMATGDGMFITLDVVNDSSATSADVGFKGHVILPTGEVAVVVGTLDGAYADAGSMTSLPNDLIRVLAPGREGMDVRVAERTIPNAGVKVSIGQILAPVAADAVSFSITVPIEQSAQPTRNPEVRYIPLLVLIELLKWLILIKAAAETIKAVCDAIRALGGSCNVFGVSAADGIGRSIQASGTATPTVTLGLGYSNSGTVDCGKEEHDQGGGS